MDLFKILDTAPEPTIVDARTMGVAEDTSGDYWLPTPMCLYQKDLTDQIVSLHYSDILKYFETKDYKEDLVFQSMKTMCLNSELVATHPYLLIDHFMPKSLLAKDIPQHLSDSSGKFNVLRDLITLVQGHKFDILIVCQSGRSMDLLEALLLGNKVHIKRYDGSSIKIKQKQRNFLCTCHLFPYIPTNTKKHRIGPEILPNLIICIDPTIDITQLGIQQLTQKRKVKHSRNTVPIIRLTTINSIDHCRLFFSKTLEKESNEYLVKVSAAVVVLRDIVGTLPPDLRPIYSQNLRYLTNWIENRSLPWPLPDVYPIKVYTSIDVEKSLLTEVHYTQSDDPLKNAFQSERKRCRKNDERNNKDNSKQASYYQMKRLKNDYSTNPLKQNFQHISDISSRLSTNDMDYNVSSGILTHAFIQSIGTIYERLQRQLMELHDFELFSDIQNNHQAKLNDDFKKVKCQLGDLIASQEDNEKQIQDIFLVSKETKEHINSLENDINDLYCLLDSHSPIHSELRCIFDDLIKYEDNIKKEKRLHDIKKDEQLYIKNEIERANNAVKDSKIERSYISNVITELEAKIEQALLNEKSKENEIATLIDSLNERIVEEEALLNHHYTQISYIMKQLKDVQPSKIRYSNTVTRHKNNN